MTSAPSPTADRHWLPWAVLGLVGSCLVAATAFGVGYLEDGPRGVLERNASWIRGSTGRYGSRLSGLVGSLLLFVSWWRLRPVGSSGARLPFRRIGLVWSLPFWIVPPLMTADAYAYAAQGWLLHQGLDPYTFAMGFPSPFAESVYPAWRPTTAVYPPLTLHLQHLIVDLTGAHPYWSPVAMRLLALAGVALMVAVTGPLARQVGASVATCLWFIALNPLLLIQLVGGAHNDALMVGLILAALWVARAGVRPDPGPADPRPAGWLNLIGACAVIGVAASVKQPAVLAGAGVVLYNVLGQQHRGPVPWGRLAGRFLVGAAVGGVTFVALSIPRGLWFGWLNDHAGSPSLVINHSPLSWLAQAALALGAPEKVVNPSLVAVSALLMVGGFVLVARWWAASRPLRFTAGLLLVFGLLGTAIQPWYVLWGGPLLTFCHPDRRVMKLLGAIVLVLSISSVLQEYLSPVITVPVGAAAAYAWWRWGPA